MSQYRTITASQIDGVKPSTNFITNGNATHANTAGWNLYVDTAGPAPVSGAGTGTNTITFTTTSTSPLSGDYSFLLTKPASNAQGQGVATPFTINNASLAKVLQLSMDITIPSGTFVAGGNGVVSDVVFYLYDITNSVLIQPSTYTINSNSATIPYQFNGTFQTASNSTSYRLIAHVSSTSTAAYTVQIDNVAVTPSTYVYGTPITEWSSYTPVLTSFGTPTNVFGQWRRVGSNLEASVFFTSGTSTAAVAQIGIPTGLTVDNSRLPYAIGNNVIGEFAYGANSATSFTVLSASSNASYINIGTQSSSSTGLTPANGNAIIASGSSASVKFTVPILGWSSSVQTSDQTDTRVVTASGYINTTLTTSNQTLALVATRDTHGTATGTSYVIPVPGDYAIDFDYTSNSTGTAIDTTTSLLVNGSVVKSSVVSAQYFRTNILHYENSFKAGDVITFQGQINVTATVTQTANTQTVWSVKRLSGPSAISAVESINGSYVGTAQSFTTSFVNFTYSTKEDDTHGAFNGTTFTAPAPGKYQFLTALTANYGSGTYALEVQLLKNGSVVRYRCVNSTGPGYSTNAVNSEIRLLTGDTIVIQSKSSAATASVSSGCDFSWARIGN